VIITDNQCNAKFVSPTHERLLADTQHCFQRLKANTGDPVVPGLGYRLMA
jgi:hypothetical protein